MVNRQKESSSILIDLGHGEYAESDRRSGRSETGMRLSKMNEEDAAHLYENRYPNSQAP